MAQRTFWDLLRQSGGVYEATLHGWSMEPTLRHGTRIRIRPLAPHEYREGQIVACTLGDELFAHRVVHCAHHALLTRGDNRVLCDPPTPRADVIGVVVEQWADDAWIPPGGAPPPRWPRLTSANDRLVWACLGAHLEFSRRVAGTVLHVGRFYRMAGAALRSLTARKT